MRRHWWVLELTRAFRKEGTLGGIVKAFELAITSEYFEVSEGEFKLEHEEALRRFKSDLEIWLHAPETKWYHKFQYVMQMVKLERLRCEARLHETVPTSVADLRKVPKKELLGWIREMMIAGELTLADVDPPPIVDTYDYAWQGKNRKKMIKGTAHTRTHLPTMSDPYVPRGPCDTGPRRNSLQEDDQTD